MPRFLAGLGLAMGFAWLFRRRKKKEPAGDPAEELKRKLEESRAAEPEPQPEPPVEQPERPLDERRDEVHRRARESIDRMRGEQ
jgi:hypothetical protein